MKIVSKKEAQKGFTPLVIILGVAVLVLGGFLVGRLIKPGAEQVATLPSPTPTAATQATSTPSASPNTSTKPTAVLTKIIKQTPTPTIAAVSPYQIEARLVCARADEGYGDGNHVDLIYKVTIKGEALPFATLTLTDNKTQDVFDFANGGPPGNSTITSWDGTLHWKTRDRDNKEMTFTADGRDYALKLYKLTTVSEAVTKDMQPIAQTTFSKVCEF